MQRVLSGAETLSPFERCLEPKFRQYPGKPNWNNKTFLLSVIIIILLWGLIKKLQNVSHHKPVFRHPTLTTPIEIYDDPSGPKPSLFMPIFLRLQIPAGPEGCGDRFFLVPIAPNLEDNKQIRNNINFWILF